jgi:hypothetical protein
MKGEPKFKTPLSVQPGPANSEAAYFAAAQLITNTLKEPTVLPPKDKTSFVEVS